jgi:DNA-binding HxlR family transcriptional regulator
LETSCGMAYTISMIGGRWKLSILGLLSDFGTLRYNELQSRLHGISDKVLNAQLKALEHDELIVKRIYAQIPPKTEYELSEKGISLKPVLEAMSGWGNANSSATMASLF